MAVGRRDVQERAGSLVCILRFQQLGLGYKRGGRAPLVHILRFQELGLGYMEDSSKGAGMNWHDSFFVANVSVVVAASRHVNLPQTDQFDYSGILRSKFLVPTPWQLTGHLGPFASKEGPVVAIVSWLPGIQEPNRSLSLMLLKSIATHHPFLARCFGKRMPSSWQKVGENTTDLYHDAAPILVSRCFCRSLGIRGHWNPPKTCLTPSPLF